MAYEAHYHSVVHDYLHDARTYQRLSGVFRRRYFSMIGPDHSVFEYGCGLGQNLFGLPARHKLGYDISQYARDFCAQKGIQVVPAIETVPTGAFDFVISRHTLEHLADPYSNLQMLRSLIKPGGRLILILPEERPFLLDSYEPDIHDHLFAWTPRTLANLLNRAGYAVDAIRREPNSGLSFFAPVADWSYPLLRFLMTLTDLVRRVPGEWVAEAHQR